MFILELHASDIHAVLGRLLDQTRVAPSDARVVRNLKRPARSPRGLGTTR